MTEFLRSGAVFDLVLAAVALELAVFCGYFLLRREHLVAADVYANLGAGIGLALAARLMLASAWWGLSCLSLCAALLAHVLALQLRRLSRDARAAKDRRNLSPDGFRGGTMMQRLVRFTEVPDE